MHFVVLLLVVFFVVECFLWLSLFAFFPEEKETSLSELFLLYVWLNISSTTIFSQIQQPTVCISYKHQDVLKTELISNLPML